MTMVRGGFDCCIVYVRYSVQSLAKRLTLAFLARNECERECLPQWVILLSHADLALTYIAGTHVF